VDGANACSCPPEFVPGLTEDSHPEIAACCFPASLTAGQITTEQMNAGQAATGLAPASRPWTAAQLRENGTGNTETSALPPQKQELMQALRQANGNITEAAKLLGIHRGTVRNRMLKWGIDLRRTVFS